MRSPAAESYRRQIVSGQETLRQAAAARNIPVIESVDTLTNAVFVSATPDRMDELKGLPGVTAVIRMRWVHPLLNRATALMNAPAAWTALGGQGVAGQGMKVGVLDYGIDQTHPAFQDPSLPMPDGFPKFTEGHPEDKAYTTNKVIVARSYTRLIAPGSSATNPAADSRPDDFSPRDHEGHGTAVASVIAANSGTGTVTITGMAPKAYLGSYKIFGTPGVNDGATEAVIIKALEDATKDGMDVVNISAGISALTGPLDTGAACGLAANAPCDLLATAFENAVKAGVVVVAAAGNSGNDGNNYPTFNSISTPADAPGVIAVGATSNSHFFTPTVSVVGGPSNLQNLAAQPGDDFSSPVGAVSAPVRDVTTLGNDGFACTALPAGGLSGVFALIQRSIVGSATACSFATKVDNAFDAGAVGVILYMSSAVATIAPGNLDFNGIPVAMISLADATALKAYISANPSKVVTIDPGGQEQDDTANSNLLAFFSSFGPTLGDAAIKPDLVAVGTSMYMAAQNSDPNGGQYSESRYAVADGTSFSSPLVAGAAALVKQKHPSWTPAQIKSALVNTAKQDVLTDDSGNKVDVQWLGAGKLDAGAAVNSTVTLSPTSLSFGVLAAAPSGLARQLTITNQGTSAVSLTVAVAAGAASSSGNLTAGISPTIDKTTLSLAPGAAGTVTVSLSGALPPAGSYSGAVTFQATGVSLRVPYLYLVGGGVTSDYNLIFVGSGGFEGIVGQAPFDPLIPRRPSSIAVKLVDGNGVPVSGATVTWTPRPRGSVTLQNTASTTNAYGIAATDVTLVQTGSVSVNVVTGGQTLAINGFGRVQPTISAGGVVNDADFKAPIAPGSYIAIFGSGLSDPGFTDSATTPALPIHVDGVTVSFDVPSAKLSLPGRIVFVSPGQVNAQVPWELQGQTSAQVKVTIDGYSFGNVVTVPLADATPAFFEISAGVAAARDQSGAVITAAAPAKRGQAVQLYLNGLGPLDNQPASGEPAPALPLATTKNTPKVNIGGQDAQILFSGLAPGFPGLYQINAVVPAGIAVGSAPMTVTIGGQTSKTSGLPVQ